MRKVLILCFLLCSQNAAFSQVQGSDSLLTSRFRPGLMWFYTGFRPAKPERLRKYDRLIVDLTYNTWNGDRKLFSNKWGSIGVNSSLMFDIPITKQNTVSFGTGLTYSFVKLRHDELLTADSTNTYSHFVGTETPQFETKQILGGSSLLIPLEFRFRTKGWKHFKVHLGGKIGYQLGLYSKKVINNSSGRSVDKTHPYPDVNNLIYSAHIRIGVRNWALYAAYNFNEIFTHAKSANLNIFQVGVSLSMF